MLVRRNDRSGVCSARNGLQDGLQSATVNLPRRMVAIPEFEAAILDRFTIIYTGIGGKWSEKCAKPIPTPLANGCIFLSTHGRRRSLLQCAASWRSWSSRCQLSGDGPGRGRRSHTGDSGGAGSRPRFTRQRESVSHEEVVREFGL